MKKVLIGLLVLAVAGGGVFAQEWQFNGDVFAGMMMLNTEGGEGPDLGLATNDPGVFRSQLRARVQDADQTAGLDMAFRVEGANWDNTATRTSDRFAFLQHGFGWLGFMDGMITLQGGIIDDAAGFNSFDRAFNTRMGEGTGLRTIIRPLGNNNLAFELGVYTNRFDQGNRMWFDYNRDEARPGRPRRPERDVDQARFVFAVRYLEPDLFQIVAGLRNTSEVRTTGYMGWLTDGANVRPGADILTAARAYDDFGNRRYAGLVEAGGRTNPSAAYVSFEYLGLAGDGIHLAASAFFMNLEEFGDMGDMRFTLSAGHTGLVEGMDLRLNATLGLSMADWFLAEGQRARVHPDPYNLPRGTFDEYGERAHEPSPWVWIWASADYQVTDTLVPRLDLHYVMGGRTNRSFASTHHRDVARGGVTFNDDDSFLRLQPSVQVRLPQANTFFEFGAILNFCLGDNPTWIPHSETRREGRVVQDNNGFNAGVYAVMRVSF